MSAKKAQSSDATNRPTPTAVEIQQEYYEAIGGVDWELFGKADRKYLLQKIAVALYGPPTKEGNLYDSEENARGKQNESKRGFKKESSKKGIKQAKCENNEFHLQGYELRDEKGIMKVFNKICEQAKYSHDSESILITILKVLCVVPKKEVPFYKITPNYYWVNLHNKNGDHVHIYTFHVFCIRQCVPIKQGVTGCRVYVDHDARVYKNWNDYLTENTLPKSVMVVPENGQYSGTFGPNVDLLQLQYDTMPRVKLSIVPSPALGIGAKVLQVSDKISTVANVGALAGVAGAIAFPVIAPVALSTAVGVGVVTGTYGIARASISLVNRRKHDQSIGLDSSKARSCWINILVSTAGISCGAAGKLLSWAAASGTNVKILMNAVNVLQYTNLGSGFIGVANSLGDMIYKYHKYKETPTRLEVFQFTTSVLFLGIGVMSNQTAQEIVQDAQANKINEVRESLSSNNKKKMFDKVTAETRRTRGTIQGNAEVIQALKKIENKDEFFGILRGMNKQIDKHKLRISLSNDGNPLINNEHNIRIADLQALGRRGRDTLFAKCGRAKMNSKNAPRRIYASDRSTKTVLQKQKSTWYIRPKQIFKITHLIMGLSRIDQEFVADLLSNMSANFHDAFLLTCAEIIASLIPAEINLLIGWNKNYKVRIILFVFDYLKSKIPVNDSDDNSLANDFKKYLRDGFVPKETILELKRTLFDRITQKKRIFDDHHVFDIMHDYDTRYKKKYLTLQAGDILKIGKHDILVKNSTIENLKEWFQDFSFSQVQCEMLINICVEIISLLTANELLQLNEINPDDDAIKITAYYLLFIADGILDFLIENFLGTGFLTDKAYNLKGELMNWRACQEMRDYEICKVCQCRQYKDNE